MLHISPFSGQQTSHILDFTPLLSSVKLWDCRWFCVMVLVPFYSIVPVACYTLSSSVSVQFQISEPRATATGDVIYFLKYSLATNNMERESVILLTCLFEIFFTTRLRSFLRFGVNFSRKLTEKLFETSIVWICVVGAAQTIKRRENTLAPKNSTDTQRRKRRMCSRNRLLFGRERLAHCSLKNGKRFFKKAIFIFIYF